MPKGTSPAAVERLPVPEEMIERRIYLIRGLKVMLDSDLAELYQVSTKALNQAARRNLDRFPEDFMFKLSDAEAENLRSHIVTSNSGHGGGLDLASSSGRRLKPAPQQGGADEEERDEADDGAGGEVG